MLTVEVNFEEKPVALGHFRGAVDSARCDRAFLEALSDPLRLMASGEVFHSGRNRLAVVALADSSGRRVEAVLKQFRPLGVDRLKSLVFASKALKAWRGAAWLLRRNIPTPRPLAFMERKNRGLTVEGYFLAEKLDTGREVRHLFRSLAGEEMDKLLRALAVFLRNCHGLGVLHKDLSDGNILAVADGRGGYGFNLLDTNRVRIKKKIGLLAAAGNLVRLGIPLQFRLSFLSYYWQGRPVPPLFWAWYRFRKKWYTGMVGLKKRLRLRKLARKLGVQ
jgi:hypothetical protein